MRIEGHENDEEEPEADKDVPWDKFWTHRSSQLSFSKKNDIPAENNEQYSWK